MDLQLGKKLYVDDALLIRWTLRNLGLSTNLCLIRLQLQRLRLNPAPPTPRIGESWLLGPRVCPEDRPM